MIHSAKTDVDALLKVTCGLFDGMVHDDAHGLVHTGHQSGDVATMELICPHHLAGVALRPVDVVLEDCHTVRVLENLVCGIVQEQWLSKLFQIKFRFCFLRFHY